MAGAGRRTFQPGEVLTASNVNSYLMDQSVMRFASSAARGSAVGTAVIAEGMVSYLTDSDALEFYDGTDWKRFAAGTGLPIANGGTGATTLVAAQNNLRSGLVQIIPSGVQFTGGTVSVSGQTVTATGVSSVRLQDVFSGEYDNYKIVVKTMGPATLEYLKLRYMRANNTLETGTIYYYRFVNVTNAGALSGNASNQNHYIVGTTWNTTGDYGNADINLYAPGRASHKSYNFTYGSESSGAGGGYCGTTEAFTGFELFNNTTFSATIRVYGFND